MRVIWAVFGSIAAAATVAIWLLAAGWAGGSPWLPDTQLLATGEWPLWIAMFLLLYGPPAFGAWCLAKAVRAED